jgi:hypothetical protein
MSEPRCQKDEMAAGRAYPRTCERCGFGPCAKGYDPKWTIDNPVGVGPERPTMAEQIRQSVSVMTIADRLQRAIDLATAYHVADAWAEACNGVRDDPDLTAAVVERRKCLRELLEALKP